jgi:PhzF family phenazine biosynthesis protein
MALCGHGTIAACFALVTRGLLSVQNDPLSISIETQAGILPITLTKNTESVMVSMRQASAHFVPFNGSHNDVATVLGISPYDIDSRYPIVYGSTGIWTLLVPVRSLETFKRMNPQNHLFPSLLSQFPHASIHPFCLETYNSATQMHGRHFSSPFSGTKEDAVTGTASGAMGAYYTEYVRPTPTLEIVVEQGSEIKREGNVQVSVEHTPSTIEVTIAGVATYVAEWQYTQ